MILFHNKKKPKQPTRPFPSVALGRFVADSGL